MPLTYDLQGVGNAHRADAGIADGKPALQDQSHIHRLKGHEQPGQYRGDQSLNAVEPQTVHLIHIPVDQGDLDREGKQYAQ